MAEESGEAAVEEVSSESREEILSQLPEAYRDDPIIHSQIDDGTFDLSLYVEAPAETPEEIAAREAAELEGNKTPEEIAAEAAAAEAAELERLGGGAPAPAPAAPAAPAPAAPDTVIQSILGDEYKGAEGLQAFKAKFDSLQEQLKASPADGIKNEKIRKLSSFIEKTGIDNLSIADQVINSDTKDMSSIELLALEQIINQPNLVGKMDLVKRSISKRYEVDEDTATEDEKEMAKFDLDMAAGKAKQAIDKINEDVNSGFTTIQDTVEAKAEADKKLQTEWVPNVAPISEGFNKVSLFGKTVEGETPNPLFEYEVTPEQAQKYARGAIRSLIQMGEMPTSENLDKVRQIMNGAFIIEHQAEINDAFAKSVRASVEDEFEKKYNGAGPVNREGGNSGGGSDSPVSASDAMMADIEKNGV